ncbi:guanylylate cyclase [Cystoisospora suis]|uniref:Guanylylate cyclase n=1 Tax=Cystoisospora suis TaxID=483139 RepID=A0A2C6JW03_9APIC|nr:guanylylate cyclase [Cystoisospora suis]
MEEDLSYPPSEGSWLEVRWLGQRNEKDCGLACVRMILEKVRQQCETSHHFEGTPCEGEHALQSEQLIAASHNTSKDKQTPSELCRKTSLTRHLSSSKAAVGNCYPAPLSVDTGEALLLRSSRDTDVADAVSGSGKSSPRLSMSLFPWWVRREVVQGRRASINGEGPEEGPRLPRHRDVSPSTRRKEVVALWERLAEEGAWTVDLLLLLVQLGFGARCFLATVYAGFNSTHLARPFYQDLGHDEQQRVLRQFSRVRQEGGVVLNRTVTNEELRSFLCEEGLVICLIHKTILDAYRDTLASEKVTARFTDVSRAKERAKQAAEAAARSEYEGHFILLIGAQRSTHPTGGPSIDKSLLTGNPSASALSAAYYETGGPCSSSVPLWDAEQFTTTGYRPPSLAISEGPSRPGTSLGALEQNKHHGSTVGQTPRHAVCGMNVRHKDNGPPTTPAKETDAADLQWEYLFLDPGSEGLGVIDERALDICRRAEGTDEDLLFFFVGRGAARARSWQGRGTR